jgi:hypothetical protein
MIIQIQSYNQLHNIIQLLQPHSSPLLPIRFEGMCFLIYYGVKHEVLECQEIVKQLKTSLYLLEADHVALNQSSEAITIL